MKPGCGCHHCIRDNGTTFCWWRCLAMNIMESVARALGVQYLNEPGRPVKVLPR